jgi:hypothetical protein
VRFEAQTLERELVAVHAHPCRGQVIRLRLS